MHPALGMMRRGRWLPGLFTPFWRAISALGLLVVLSVSAVIVDRETSPVVAMEYAVFVLLLVSLGLTAHAANLAWKVFQRQLDAFRQEAEDEAKLAEMAGVSSLPKRDQAAS